MDSKTQVLLYLQRNESVRVSRTGQIITKRSEPEITPSRGSSVGSGRSSNNSRSSTPTSYSTSHRKTQSSLTNQKIPPQKSEFPDQVSTKVKKIIQELVECQILKSSINRKYLKEEKDILAYLNDLLEVEKKRIKIKTDHNYNPVFRKEAESIVQKEKAIENLIKNNKAMKTLMAEMTLNEVDSRISVDLDRRTKFENLSIITYLKKYGSLREGQGNEKVLLKLKKKKKEVFREKSNVYWEKVKSVAESFIQDLGMDGDLMCSILCKEIVDEQAYRLSSEESADKCIFEKEMKIKQLEESIENLSGKYK